MSGYFTFGDAIASSVLDSYPEDNGLLTGLRAALSLALCFSYPVAMTPGRQCLSTMVFGRNIRQVTMTKYVGITLFMLAFTFTVSMIVDDLGLILAFIGSTYAPVAVFVLPALFYLSIQKKMDALPENENNSSCRKLNRRGSIIALVVGIGLIPVSIAFLFL